MIKTFIKQALRENLFKRLAEKSKNTQEPKSEDEETSKEYGELSPKEQKKVDTQTIEIRQAVGPGKSLKISQAIEDANLGSATDASARGKFTQKIFGRNDRHLSPKEAAALSKVTKNPGAYN
jgi:hypothetical protein